MERGLPGPQREAIRTVPRVSSALHRPPSAFVTKAHRRDFVDDGGEGEEGPQLPARARPSTAIGLRRPATATSRPATAGTRPTTARSARLRPGTAGTSSWRTSRGAQSSTGWSSRRAPGEVLLPPSSRQTNVDISLVRSIDHGKVLGARQVFLGGERSKQIRACYLAAQPPIMMVQSGAHGARRVVGAEAKAVRDHAPVHLIKRPDRVEELDTWLSNMRRALEEQLGPEEVQREAQAGQALEHANRYDREAWAHSMARIQDQLLRRALDAEAEQAHLDGGGTLAPASGPEASWYM